jgi:hypothetical protein
MPAAQGTHRRQLALVGERRHELPTLMVHRPPCTIPAIQQQAGQTFSLPGHRSALTL